MLIIEAPHELGSAALVIRLNEQRPASRIRGQQFGATLRERSIEWELMRAIKHTLDPQGIMTPGKTLPPIPQQA